MAGEVFTGSVARTLKKVLNKIVDDPLNNSRESLIAKKWVKFGSLDDNYEDDVEYAGGGLVAQTPEGSELQPIVMKEGVVTRYRAEKFGAVMIITEEALDDCKYKEVIALSKRLDRSMYKTIDIDNTLMLMRAADTNYVGGDGVSLANIAHSLPHGGTFSNTLATPMSPSTTMVQTVWSTLAQMVGHDGTVEGYEIKKVVYPVTQHFAWRTIVGSKMDPAAGNFAAINVVNQDLDIDLVPNKYWQNTTTNCAFITDAENGLQFKYRKKPNSNSWVDHNNQIMKFSISARWARGWSDPRGFFFNNL